MKFSFKVKNTVVNALKTNLKGVIVLTWTVEIFEDDCLGDHNPNQPCENLVPSTSQDENPCERVASLEKSLVKIVAYVREEKLRSTEKNKKKKGR